MKRASHRVDWSWKLCPPTLKKGWKIRTSSSHNGTLWWWIGILWHHAPIPLRSFFYRTGVSISPPCSNCKAKNFFQIERECKNCPQRAYTEQSDQIARNKTLTEASTKHSAQIWLRRLNNFPIYCILHDKCMIQICRKNMYKRKNIISI